MKKILSLVLVALMVATMCACGTTEPTKAPATNAPTNAPTTQVPTTTQSAPQGPTVVTLSDYFADESKWEDDGGYFDMDDEKIFFDNFSAGDYAAVRMNEEHQNVTYKFNVTINKLAPVSMEDWTWWDSEFCVIARSTLAASSWQDDGSQKGYTLTWWGDMSEVAIGRCGMDDAFGTFQANIGDGQAHDIEFTVVNNEDGTVSLKLVIDGNVIAEVVDDGTKSKNDRPTLYPDAGGLTIRAKWLEAIVK
jgi:predicted small lipoprotein YifL